MKKGKRYIRKGLAFMLTGVLLVSTFFSFHYSYAITKEEEKAAVKGIDVSAYNNTVDFETVKKKGYTYVMWILHLQRTMAMRGKPD